MPDKSPRTATFSIARPEPSRALVEVGFQPSLAMEVATSLMAAALPDEFNHSPRLARILASVGDAAGKARELLGTDVEAASWTVVGAGEVLDAVDPGSIAEAIAAAAPAAAKNPARALIAATWGPAVAREWLDYGLKSELLDSAERARSRLLKTPAAPAAHVAELIATVTGLRPLTDQLREIGRFPGAKLVFVPSHFTDPSTGYLYSSKRCVILFSSRRGLAEALQQEGPLQARSGAAHAGPEAVDAAQVTALKALADPMRLRILQLVADRSLYTSELATALGLTQPAISHHITVLKGAGLVRVVRSGPYVYVHLVPARLSEVAELLSAIAGPDQDE